MSRYARLSSLESARRHVLKHRGGFNVLGAVALQANEGQVRQLLAASDATDTAAIKVSHDMQQEYTLV